MLAALFELGGQDLLTALDFKGRSCLHYAAGRCVHQKKLQLVKGVWNSKALADFFTFPAVCS